MAARLAERLLQRVQFRGRHADVDRALGHRKDVHACVAQELLEVLAQVVVGDLPLLAAEFVLHRRAVVHVVRRIAKDHVGQAAGEDLLHVSHLRGIAAQQPVLPENPDVAGNRDCGLRSLRHRVIVCVANVYFLGLAEAESSISSSVNPTSSRLNPSSSSAAISTRSISSSHPALSASRLSASTNARRWDSVR